MASNMEHPNRARDKRETKKIVTEELLKRELSRKEKRDLGRLYKKAGQFYQTVTAKVLREALKNSRSSFLNKKTRKMLFKEKIILS